MLMLMHGFDVFKRLCIMEKLGVNILINQFIDNACDQYNNEIMKEKIKFRRKRKICLLKSFSVRRKIPKLKNYFHLIKKYPDDVFYSHFRMNRSTLYVSF